MRTTLTAILLALSASMASAQSTDFYSSSGERLGTAWRHGNSTDFYSSGGEHRGTAVHNDYDTGGDVLRQRYDNIFRK